MYKSMKRLSCYVSTAVIAASLFAACNNQPASESKKETDSTTTATSNAQPAIFEETITFKGDSATMNGFVAYDTSNHNKRPAILIIPEWWGLNDYPKMRARELAKLGYVALAMDMYGDGKVAENPDQAQKLAMPFYTNPQKAKARFDAALAALKRINDTDTGKLAAIGYCFGGGMALNVARLGEPVKGVVSFHGTLVGTPANKDLLKAKVLVCHGEADKFVKKEEVDKFKKQMDSIHADYTFKSYPNATHAFTNPAATETGKKFNMPIAYNPAADSASWKDMQQFFDKIFK
jgi:dienelactone hydrolase